MQTYSSFLSIQKLILYSSGLLQFLLMWLTNQIAMINPYRNNNTGKRNSNPNSPAINKIVKMFFLNILQN